MGERLRAGEAHDAISASLGIDKAHGKRTCIEIARVLNLPDPKSSQEQFQDEVTRRCEAGESIAEIAKATGKSKSYVADVRRSLGFPSYRVLRLSAAEKGRVQELLIDGLADKAVARKVGCDPGVPARLRKRMDDQLQSSARLCACGRPSRHPGLCSPSPELIGRVRARLLEGALVSEIATELGRPVTSVRHYSPPIVAELATAGATCRCGKRLGHIGRCAGVDIRSPSKAATRKVQSVVASKIPQAVRRRVRHLIRSGVPVTRISQETNASPHHVRMMVDEYAAAGQLPATCAYCPRPYLHAGSCRKPNKCKCGRRRGHPAACRISVAGASLRIKPEVAEEILRRIRSGDSINAIRSAVRVSFGTVKRLMVAEQDGRKLVIRDTCVCGRPAYHPGGCFKYRADFVDRRLQAAIRERVLKGETIRQIADALELAPATVARHSIAARAERFAAGQSCACGREIGHQFWCSATYEEAGGDKGRRPFEPDLERRATAALLTGRALAELAPELGVSVTGLRKLRQSLSAEQRARRSAAIRQRDNLTDEASADRIMASIRRVLPREMSAALSDDVISEIFLAVMEGRIEVADIGRAARSFINQGIAQWENQFGPRSLDATLASDGAATFADRIDDTTTSNQLDELTIGEPDHE